MQEQIKSKNKDVTPEDTESMDLVKFFIHNHPAMTYFIITFVISWGLFIGIVGIDGIPGNTEDQENLLYVTVFALLAGPFVAGPLMTALVYGKDGLRTFLIRLSTWRREYYWYLITIFGAPLIGTVTLVVLIPLDDIYTPEIINSNDKITLILTALMIGFSAGFFEEFGWTGFAIPELRNKYSVVKTGLIVGFLWGVWHYITAFWAAGNDTGEFIWEDQFVPMMLFYIAVLPAFRVLMVWVYDQTSSLLLAIVMHSSLTGSVIFILLSPDLTGTSLSFWYIVFAVPLWVIVSLLVRIDNE